MSTRRSLLGQALLKHAPLLAILALQTVCCLYLVGDMALSILGIYYEPLSWRYQEYLEIGAAFGLIAGIGLGARMLFVSISRSRRAEEKLHRAKGAFMDVMEQRFARWGLSPAERDVALFAIKGCSVAEIAGMRGTSEGTVKAQTAAVYRKAGVANRHQLLSLFIEDLFDPDLAARPDAAPAIDQAAPSPAPVSASASAVASPAQQ